MTAWLDKLERLKALRAEREAAPLREKVEAAVRDKQAIGTAPLLDLLCLGQDHRQCAPSWSDHALFGLCADQIASPRTRWLSGHGNPGLDTSSSWIRMCGVQAMPKWVKCSFLELSGTEPGYLNLDLVAAMYWSDALGHTVLRVAGQEMPVKIRETPEDLLKG
jgi:hypothetical protein